MRPQLGWGGEEHSSCVWVAETREMREETAELIVTSSVVKREYIRGNLESYRKFVSIRRSLTDSGCLSSKIASPGSV